MAVARKVDVSKLLIEIKDKTKAIMESNSNANYIVDLIESAETENDEIVTAFIKAVHKIFSKFLSQRVWFKNIASGNEKLDSKDEQGGAGENSKDPEDLFRDWLHEKYLLAVKRLLQLLHRESQNVRELSLCVLMKFVVAEAKAMKKTSYHFPNTLFRKLCDSLVDGKDDMTATISRFCANYMEFSDVVYYVLKNVSRLLQEVETAGGRYFGENIFALLSGVKMKTTDEELDQFLLQPQAKKKAKGSQDTATFQHEVAQVKSHRKVFSSAWLRFLRLPLKPAIHKKVLVSLHGNVMPHLLDPKLLMDFLTDSYNLGGANSLLALNGLFILLHQHNLDYPQFYNKLYALFEPGIFHIKYRSRFFSLADLFLSSTHLPAYLVAAFAKRLARLALTAPPSGAMLAIPFVCNLIRRHPSCQVLIHRKQVGMGGRVILLYITLPLPTSTNIFSQLLRELTGISEVVRIGSIIVFHLNKL